jgi:hypothetical protein
MKTLYKKSQIWGLFKKYDKMIVTRNKPKYFFLNNF